MSQDWIIDTNLIKFGPDGVDEFASPYNPFSLKRIQANLNLEIWAGLGEPKGSEMFNAFHVARGEICIYTMFLAQLAVTKRRASQYGKNLIATENAFGDLLRYAESGSLPDLATKSRLVQGPIPTELWRIAARYIKGHLYKTAYKRLPKAAFNPQKHYLVSASTRLSETWFVEQKQPTVLWDPNWYFSKAPKEAYDIASDELELALTRLLEYVLGQFSQHDIAVTNSDISWLREQWKLILCSARYHLNNIQAQTKIPKHFLAASCGDVWEQITRLEVKRRGGTVVTFEHGCGLGFHGYANPYLADLNCSDTHVCFDAGSAKRIQASFKALNIPNLALPELSWCDDAANNVTVRRKLRKYDHKPVVLFAPQATAGQRVRNETPYPPDITCLDLNARIIGALEREGCDVIIKPHPADAGPSYTQYVSELGHRCSASTFEQEIPNADFIVSAAPSSTTILAALNNDIPTIVVNPDTPPISEAGLNFIRTKAVLFHATLGENEKFEINWQDFGKAVRNVIEDL